MPASLPGDVSVCDDESNVPQLLQKQMHETAVFVFLCEPQWHHCRVEGPNTPSIHPSIHEPALTSKIVLLQSGMHVGGIMGTSAGALTGSLYAAGYTPREVARELSRVPPIQLLRPSLEPWKGGLLTLDGVVDRLREVLPSTFEELEKDFAVGVVTDSGEHVLIDSGPLPEAVAASAAIPVIFNSVEVPGKDGWLQARTVRLLVPVCFVGCHYCLLPISTRIRICVHPLGGGSFPARSYGRTDI